MQSPATRIGINIGTYTRSKGKPFGRLIIKINAAQKVVNIIMCFIIGHTQ